MTLTVSVREFHTMLAALRLYQTASQGAANAGEDWIRSIASNGGLVVPLTTTQIDQLCWRLNTQEKEASRG